MKKQTILNFYPITKGFRKNFAISFVFVILSVVFSYLTPQVVRLIIDSVIGDKPFDLPQFLVNIIERNGGRDFLVQNLVICAIASFLLSTASALCDLGSRINLAKAAEGSLETLRNLLFGHIQRLPYRWHGEHQTGDIIQRCTMDVETLKVFVTEHLQALVRTVFLIVIALVLMFAMNPLLATIAFIFIPITLTYSLVFYKLIGSRFRSADECEGELSSVAQENLTAVHVVRAFGRERHEVKKFEERNNEFADRWINLGVVMGLNWGIGDFIGFVQIVSIITGGTILAVNSVITLGDFVAFVYYNSMLVWPIRQLGRILSELSKSTISARRLFEILDSEEEKSCENPVEADMAGDIEFSNVSFGYDDKTKAVKDINIKLKGGETLGILGATGSGKSTLVSLLDRLYELDDDGGCITIGGVDIRNIDREYLRKHIGIVLQEPFLFSKTFKENISDGAGNDDIDRIREFADISVIDSSIMSFANGYDTMIGERGVTISGGQRQRVAIARMLSQETPIKIFDDSLSAVDMETDAKIREAINTRIKGTTIIISHRIATVMNADIIIVMEKGRIIQRGIHKSLIKEDGIYRRIYESQSAKED